ncbi:MAG: hypothetical protein K2X27_08330 [Candidatus Obscuribacterales bacterium]|nr:hypothetical protein [Candidatus Obscuribacterales bacterium]
MESWVNRYQMSRPSEESKVFPRLADLQKLPLSKRKDRALNFQGLLNPVSGKREWPRESPCRIADYRRILADQQSFVGRACIEYLPLVEKNSVIGYIIRAGDPETGKVLCSNGRPCIRSNP